MIEEIQKIKAINLLDKNTGELFENHGMESFSNYYSKFRSPKSKD